jgi:predicted dehydrogenase
MLKATSIGLGWWSNELAAAIQGKSRKIGIVSCYSRSPEKRRKFAATFKTGMHETMEALLADPAIDAVILTTPHSLHAEQVIAAARAGKHVFVEKPFTLTAMSGQRAARACADAGVVLAVGHNRRFSAVTREIKRMADDGEFGEILHIETNFSAPSAMNWTKAHWRASRTESPAGGLAGLGVHMIDLFTYLGGPAERVLANARRRVLKVDVEDTTSALVDLASGATAYLGTLCAAPFTVLCNVYGTRANAFAHVDANELRVQPVGAKMSERPLQPVDTLVAELEEFADACAGNGQFRVRPQEAIHVVAVMEAIAASAARSGQAVKIPLQIQGDAQ